VACADTESDCTEINWWARCFPVSTATAIEGLTFGVFQTNGPPPTGTWQLRVKLWSDNDGTCPPGALGAATLLGETIVPVSNAQEGQLLTGTFSPPIGVSAGTALIAEVGIDQSGCAIGAGINFYTAANNQRETAPSYIRSAPCGLTNWTSHAAIGFGDLHTVMTLLAVDPDGNDQNGDQIPDECEVGCLPNGVLDIEAIANFALCFGGPGNAVLSGCACFDVHPDGAVDLKDFANVQTEYVGH
jgi:hypothetical protein